MDDATFYSKNFYRDLPIDFSLRGAQQMEARGELEAWVHAYLTCEPRWRNPGLSTGLRSALVKIHGIVELSVASLERKCGPEPEMEYWQDAASFEMHIGAIETTLEALEDLPPLVVEDIGGQFMVCDGTHRLEAIRRKGWRSCWVILFSTPSSASL